MASVRYVWWRNISAVDTYVKTCILANGKRVMKKRTRVVHDNCNPTYRGNLKYPACNVCRRCIQVRQVLSRAILSGFLYQSSIRTRQVSFPLSLCSLVMMMMTTTTVPTTMSMTTTTAMIVYDDCDDCDYCDDCGDCDDDDGDETIIM